MLAPLGVRVVYLFDPRGTSRKIVFLDMWMSTLFFFLPLFSRGSITALFALRLFSRLLCVGRLSWRHYSKLPSKWLRFFWRSSFSIFLGNFFISFFPLFILQPTVTRLVAIYQSGSASPGGARLILHPFTCWKKEEITEKKKWTTFIPFALTCALPNGRRDVLLYFTHPTSASASSSSLNTYPMTNREKTTTTTAALHNDV